MVHAAGARKRTVAALRNGDRKARGKARDAVYAPPLCETLRQNSRAPKRQGIVVADYEIVRGIEGGKRPAQVEVRKVDRVEPGSVVHRLAERVGRQEGEVGGAP